MRELKQQHKPASRPSGGQPGNGNAIRPGNDLRFEMFLSKTRRGFFEEYFELQYGRPARSEDELRQVVRRLANNAIDHAMAEVFERMQPGRVTQSMGEVF